MSLRIGEEVQSLPPGAEAPLIESAWRCQGWTLLAMDQADAIERFKRYFGWSRVPAGTVIERVET